MTKYESHYKEMRFYVEGTAYRFRDGVFNTDNDKVKAFLETLSGVRKIEEAQPVEHAEETKEEPKEEVKEEPKKQTRSKRTKAAE